MRARFRVTLNIQTCVQVCDHRARRRAVRLEMGYPTCEKEIQKKLYAAARGRCSSPS